MARATLVAFTGVLLISLVQSAPLTSTSVNTLAQSLMGTVLSYNVTGEPPEQMSPAFGLWTLLEEGPDPYVKPSEPALYIQAQDVNDVVESLRFAADHSLRAATYAAGHQVVGVSLLPNGVVIDTKNLTAIDVNPDSQTAYVQAGVDGQELCEATALYNLFWPTGHLGSVGVAGIALGGGLGIGSNRVGPSVDSVLGIDVVSTWQNSTADWDIVRINASSHSDLFWGMLGGGSMLATAVGFELQLHTLPEGGMLEQGTAIWPLPAGLEAFQWYNDWKETAPSALETEFATATTPMGAVATVSFTNWDPANSSDVNEAIEAFTSGAMEAGALEVVPDTVDLIGFLAGYTARIPPGPISYYINDRFLLTVPDELAESLLSLYANATSPYSVLLIAPAPPSVAGRNNSDTAFGYRDTWYIWVWPFWLRTAGGAAADGDAEHIAWAAEGGEILDIYALGHYINMNRFDTPGSTKSCFPPPNWTRLQQVKKAYDPHNLFRPLDYYRTDDGFSGIAGDADY